MCHRLQGRKHRDCCCHMSTNDLVRTEPLCVCVCMGMKTACQCVHTCETVQVVCVGVCACVYV